MTVAAAERVAGPIVCTGGETLLPYGFRILAAGDLAVWRRRGGNEQRLQLSVDYTVTGVGTVSGGNVTLLEAAIDGDVYFIEGDRPQVRVTDLVYNRALPPAALNPELDSLQIQIRELRDRWSRTLQRSRFDDPDLPPLELPPAEAGKVIGFDLARDLDLFEPGTGGGGGGTIPNPLPIDDGGTGGNTAAKARTNLELGDLAVQDTVTTEQMPSATRSYIVQSRSLNQPPVSPSVGQIWRVGAAPLAGAWSAYTPQVDLARCTATSPSIVWERIVPANGWEISVIDEEVRAHFLIGSWRDSVDIASIGTRSTQRTMEIRRSFASGTAPTSITAGSWQSVAWNTLVANYITEANGASGDCIFLGTAGSPTPNVALSKGRRTVKVTVPFAPTGTSPTFFKLRLRNATTGAIVKQSQSIGAGGLSQVIYGEMSIEAPVEVLAATETLVVEVYATQAGTLGRAAGIAGSNEEYGSWIVTDLEGLAGPPGDKGDQGIPGDIAGPASSVNNALALFNGVTGKLIKELPPGAAGTLLGVSGGAPVFQYYRRGDVATVSRTKNMTFQEKSEVLLDAREFGYSRSASGVANVQALNDGLAWIADNLGRGQLHLYAGADIEGTIASVSDNVGIAGQGRAVTILNQLTNNVGSMSFSGQGVNLRGFGINYQSTPAVGADAIDLGDQFAIVDDVWVLSSYRALLLNAAHGAEIHKFKATNYAVNGILANGVIGARISNLHLNAGNAANGTLGGLRFTENCEAFALSNVEVLEGLYSLTMDAVTPGFGTRPAYFWWSNVVFDAAARGSLMTDCALLAMMGGWFSGGRTGSGYHGLEVDNCKYVTFNATAFVNCGKSGAFVKNTCKRVYFMMPMAACNSVTAGPGVGHGIEFEDGTTDCGVLWPLGGNDALGPGVGQQGYDVKVPAGAAARIQVVANSQGGTLGVVSHGGTGAGNVADINGDRYGGSLIPFLPGGAALGSTTNGYTALRGHTGFDFNIGNGNWRQLHSSGLMDIIAGELRIQSPGTNAKSVVVREAVREKLTATRTYYVRTDGNDANTGLADTAGGAFLTKQRAWNVIVGLDQAGFEVTVQVRDGTRTVGLNCSSAPTGPVTFQGNNASPSNCVISTTGDCVSVGYAGPRVTFKWFRLVSSGGSAVLATGGANVLLTANQFGACGGSHIRAVGASVVVSGNYDIVGGAGNHLQALLGGSIELSSNTVTLFSTPSFGTAFANADTAGVISAFGMTFSGTATGTRYQATLNGAINTYSGGSATYFPGSVSGVTASGGQYA